MENWVRDLLPPAYNQDEDMGEWAELLSNVLTEGEVKERLIYPLLLSVYSEDRINAILKRLPLENRTNLGEIVLFLKRHLTNEESNSYAQFQLWVVQMRNSESPEQFGDRVLNLAKKAFPALDREAMKDIAKESFLKGLPEGLRHDLRIVNPRNIPWL